MGWDERFRLFSDLTMKSFLSFLFLLSNEGFFTKIRYSVSEF